MVVVQEVSEFQGTGLVASYRVVPAASGIEGMFDVEFTTTAHSWNIVLLLQAVQSSADTSVAVKVTPDLETAELRFPTRVSHPVGLNNDRSVAPVCTSPSESVWSAAPSSTTASGLDEVVVRVPGAVATGGVHYTLSNVRVSA